MSAISEFKKLLAEAQQQQKDAVNEDVGQTNPDTSIPSKAADYLNKSTKRDKIPSEPEDIETQRWNDPLLPLDQKFVTFKDMNNHYNTFLQRIQQQMSTIGGGGEVNLRNLDDVSKSTISDNRFLTYDQNSKKFIFSDLQDDYTTSVNDNVISVINLPQDTALGPIKSLLFDITHEHTVNEEVGTICWDQSDQTLNVFHPNGVRQQVGQEQYAFVSNDTGSTLANGTVVRFDGAAVPDGEARIQVAPLIADGKTPGLYTIGVTTHDIEDGTDGKVTIFGKVRGVNTTGSLVSETWNQGDILYASPTIAGNLTKIKPTAPNNVTPIAAVLTVDASNGELFIRPTLEQKESYGRFSRSTIFTFAAIDTAYALDFDTTEITNGVELDSPASRMAVDQSGFYQIDINLQSDAGGGGFSAAILYTWIRVNGSDVPNTTRRQGLLGSAPSSTFSFNLSLSLEAGDYVEVMVATNDADVILDAAGATSFAPSTSSALVSVTQLQL